MAIQYAERGANLILVARRKQQLEETVGLCSKDVKILTIVGDLAQPNVSIKVRDEIVGVGRLDLAIMNHAVVPAVLISEGDRDNYEKELRSVMEINFFSIVRLTHALTDILHRSHGKVVSIGTAGQYVPQMFLSGYSISKQALESFIDHYRLEQTILGRNINVQHIILGEMQTEEYSKKLTADKSMTDMMLSETEGARRIMCVASRDVHQAYVPFTFAGIAALEGALRPLWPWATWNLWIQSNPDYLERTLEHMVKH